jgi:hypothetical protein
MTDVANRNSREIYSGLFRAALQSGRFTSDDLHEHASSIRDYLNLLLLGERPMWEWRITPRSMTLLGIGVVNGIPYFSQVMSSGRNGTLQGTSYAKSKLLLPASKRLPSRIFLR